MLPPILNECSDVLKNERRRVMLQRRDTGRAAVQQEENILIDGMLYKGIDSLAPRRAHMRELTTARQAAEQRYAQSLAAHRNGSATLSEAREGAVELSLELTRLDVAHRHWLYEHGEDVAQHPIRRRRMPRTTQQ